MAERRITESEGPYFEGQETQDKFFEAITTAETALRKARDLWFEDPEAIEAIALEGYPTDLGDFDEVVEQLVGWRGDMNASRSK